MSLLVVGISHRTAPLALLERAAMDAASARETSRALLGADHVEEAVVLATCNRLEVYAEVTTFHGGVADVGARLSAHAGLPLGRLTDHLYVHFGDRAVAHLFSVACGLDSMAVGEAQVLGQVRASLRRAQEDATVGRALDPLLQQALRVGKRAHTETTIDRAGPSLVEAGLDHAARVLGGLDDVRVLVVGAGAMSALAATTAHRQGVASLTVANRTPERARSLAASVGGTWTGLDDAALTAALADADLVLTCTGALGHVIEPDVVRAARRRRGSAPQVLVDLALPRDVAPDVAGTDGVTVVDLDSLGAALAHGDGVAEGVDAAAAIVAEEVSTWVADQRAAAVAPTVAALRARAREVVSGEVARLHARLGEELDERTTAELERTVHRVVDKLLHTPTVRVKSLAAAEPEGASYAAALRELFDLDLDEVASVTDVLRAVPADPVPAEIKAGDVLGPEAPSTGRTAGPEGGAR